MILCILGMHILYGDDTVLSLLVNASKTIKNIFVPQYKTNPI